MNVEPTVLLANALVELGRVQAYAGFLEQAGHSLDAAQKMLINCAQDFNALEARRTLAPEAHP